MFRPCALPLEVEEALARGWVVVTGNQRAARWLRRRWDTKQRAEGRTSWQPPQILAWETWLTALYRTLVREGRAQEVLLNSAQEHALWRAVIADDETTGSLLPVDALAESAARAWALLHGYGGRERIRRYEGNSDTRVFAGWVPEFERRLKRGPWITPAQTAQRLAAAVVARQVSLPAGVLLAGFDRMTPSQEALNAAAQAVGVEMIGAREADPAERRRVATFETELEEMRGCARWARRMLQQNPQAEIAVIVPDIEPVRAEMEREFRAVLAPELNDVSAPGAAGPFEFSLGVPLLQVPLAATAMTILRWALGALPLETVSSLLMSSYFAQGARHDERLARAELDAFVLRRQRRLEPRYTADAVLRMASREGRRETVPVLLNHLAALRSAAGAPELPLLGSYAQWAETMADILSAAGWAPAAELDSMEFQARRKWESALDELATLDFDDRRVPFAQAVDALEQVVRRTLFAPESRSAPVQIMGPMEAAGSRFDAVWFLRANDVEWKTTGIPNPLLAWQMQRDLNMPGTVPANDAAMAQRITRRVAASGAEVVFSYARESADGPQRVSAALAGLELEPFEFCATAEEAVSGPTVEAETLTAEPALAPLPDEVLHGGAAVLERQAACPFRAFAEMRLHSMPLDSIDPGLDARERGSVVHHVLQLFWNQVRSQAELRAMSLDARNSTLDACIDAALAKQARTPEPGWAAAYVDTERQRLRNLLQPWLNYEAGERTPFVVKEVEEQHADVAIGPLRLSVKVDRVDTWLKDGHRAGEIILDYKTHLAKVKDWEGERPDAPQLPLYAVVTGSAELAGVAFASVVPGEKRREIRGIASEKDVLPKAGRAANLTEQVAEWRTALVALAEEFHAGRVDVRPKEYPLTCRYCQQKLLCRLDPASLSADELEEEERMNEEDYG